MDTEARTAVRCTSADRVSDSRLGYIGATVIRDACIYVAERSAEVFTFKVESVLGETST